MQLKSKMESIENRRRQEAIICHHHHHQNTSYHSCCAFKTIKSNMLNSFILLSSILFLFQQSYISCSPASSNEQHQHIVHNITRRHSEEKGTNKNWNKQETNNLYNVETVVLLDTTEQSSLGWTKYPDGGPQTRTPGWVEESFTNFERGINWRSFVVCDVAFNSVNNYLWTPYIETGQANRLYIEIKFTMRDCNLFPQMVLSCKETFALLYKEVDEPNQLANLSPSLNSNLSFAQADSYTMIDAIAADEGRFTSNNDVVINTEIRSIPVSKRGVYFAFRDQGACLSLISIKVYHLQCPQLTTQLARFNATPTGRDLTSLVAVEGDCVPNSVQIEQPKMFCTADGQWNSMSSGQCKCLAGYEPQLNGTKCQACPLGRFKWQLGDSPCQACPEHSSSLQLASSECRCHEGFYRAPKDPRSSACTQPPSSPQNLTAIYVDSSSVVLQWQPPKFAGGRDDLTYKLICDSCDTTNLVSSPQFYANFSETKCVLSGLQPGTSYRFLIYAMNGVSQIAAASSLSGNSAAHQQHQSISEIQVQTSRQLAQTPSNTLSSQSGGFQLLPIYNFRALPGARGTDMLLAWDAQALQLSAEQLAGLASIDQSSGGLASSAAADQMPSLYEVRFQPRNSANSAIEQAAANGRRSPYPLMLEPLPAANSNNLAAAAAAQQLSVTTTNKALALSTLQPRTEYAFQIRAKWAHSAGSAGQWTEWSEPIYMATTNQVPPPQAAASPFSGNYQHYQQQQPGGLAGQPLPFNPFDPSTFDQSGTATTNNQRQQSLFQQQQQPATNQAAGHSTFGWFKTLTLVVFCSLVVIVLLALTLVHYKKSLCSLQSLSSGFGALGSNSMNSTYAGVYNGGTSSDLMGVSVGPQSSFLSGSSLIAGINNSAGLNGGANSTTLTPNHIYHNGGSLFASHTTHHPSHHHPHHLANHAHLHATLSAGSNGALITGSNSTSRSSSTTGAGNVVQQFIVATLNQIGGLGGHHNHNNTTNNGKQTNQQQLEGKLFLQQGAGNNHNNSSDNNSPTNNDSPSNQHHHHLNQHHHLQQHQTGLQQPRNHYHQMLGNANHTLLLGGQHGHFQATLPIVPNGNGNGANNNSGQQLAGGHCNQQQQQQQQAGDLFDQKYRTLSRPGAQYGISSNESQTHIYDDLDHVSSCSPQLIQQQQQQQQQPAQRLFYSSKQEQIVDPIQRMNLESILRR